MLLSDSPSYERLQEEKKILLDRKGKKGLLRFLLSFNLGFNGKLKSRNFVRKSRHKKKS